MIPLTSETKEWWERLYIWRKDYAYLVETHHNIDHAVIESPHPAFGRWRRQSVPNNYKDAQHHAVWGFQTEDTRARFMAMYGGRIFTLRGVPCPTS